MKPNDPQCPYGDKDCPKISKLEKDIRSIKMTLYAVTAFIIVKFGAEFFEVILR